MPKPVPNSSMVPITCKKAPKLCKVHTRLPQNQASYIALATMAIITAPAKIPPIGCDPSIHIKTPPLSRSSRCEIIKPNLQRRLPQFFIL